MYFYVSDSDRVASVPQETLNFLGGSTYADSVCGK